MSAEFCPICVTPMPSVTEDETEGVWGNGFCEECQEYVDNEYIALVTINTKPSVTDVVAELADVSHDERTGKVIWIHKKIFDFIFEDQLTEEQYNSIDGMVFISELVAEKLEALSELQNATIH